MGSNFAECHPVAFRFVMRAREAGAQVIHVDPRFSRTSACATQYVQIRAGTDIAFLGGLINYVVSSERWNADPFFKEYVSHYTNAATLIERDFRDASDLGGFFSGWEDDHYCPDSWQYEGTQRIIHLDGTYKEVCDILSSEGQGMQSGRSIGGSPPRDATLQDPRCVFQRLKHHFASYTPDAVAEICGVPRERFVAVAETLLRNSGRDRTSAIAYAVGWTQHTTGPQIIASAAILQLLLGNIGRPGGGIQALRGHATIQGSTDIPTLYDLLPGYLHMPTCLPIDETLDKYIWNEGGSTGLWADMRNYMVSLLKAYFGDAATAENGSVELFSGYQSALLSPPGEERNLNADEVAKVNPASGSLMVTQPGDVLIFHALTPHRSGPNASGNSRRSLYITYAAATYGDRYKEYYARQHERIAATRAADVERRRAESRLTPANILRRLVRRLRRT